MKVSSRYLAGAAGTVLLASAGLFTGSWEGERLTAYQDTGHVWTICRGLTGPWVHQGLVLTKAECDARDDKELISHEVGLLACAPEMRAVPGKTYIAINDWAYNVGVGAACKSTLIRKMKAGDLIGACGELSQWVYVQGRLTAGLVNRRTKGTPGRLSEQALCLEGVAEGVSK